VRVLVEVGQGSRSLPGGRTMIAFMSKVKPKPEIEIIQQNIFVCFSLLLMTGFVSFMLMWN
jgi:hypothetical protein